MRLSGRLTQGLVLLAALTGVAASDPAPAPGPSQPDDAAIVAQYGSVRLTVSDVKALLAAIDPAQRAELKANPNALAGVLRQRLIAQALMADAKAQAFDQRPDIQARMNDARDAALVQAYLNVIVPLPPNYPSEADVTASYEASKSRLMIPKLYHISQIALAVPAGTTWAAEDDLHRKIAKLAAEASQPKADFAALARSSSEDRASADKGGDLGWVREDQLLAGLKETISRMAEGSVSAPVRTADGWHIIKLLGVRAPAPPPIADVHDALARQLRQARQQQAIAAYLDGRFGRDSVQVDPASLSRAAGAAGP